VTKEDIIAMAREAGMKASVGKTDKDGVYHPFINALGKDVPIEWLARFAALIAAAEREACAKVADGAADNVGPRELDIGGSIADAIRERSSDLRARGQA
jgi:hypothetical protein